MASEFPHVKQFHFFKIITTQTLDQGKLMIPRMFVEKYRNCLPNAIHLKTPSGAKWKLDLVKSDGKMWFEKGWKEFAKYHSLAQGHLVHFKYERTCHFHVHIFEKSALEIKYPIKRVEAKKVYNVQGNKPPNNEDCRASQKRKVNPSFEFGSSSCAKVGKSQKLAVHLIDRKCKGKQVVTAEKVITLDRAKSFKTCNPSFVVVMAASYVEHHFSLTIPSMFGMRHFELEKKKGDIYFQVLTSGRVWPAKYVIRMRRTTFKFEVTSGWKAFAKDNNLKVGDVCKFELISSTILTFIVHIFRETDNDDTNCSTSQKSYRIKEEDIQG